ncbi:uncharacterized protein Z520_00476 [Fonsecaea multimorphosa CBS 102226]|uniref:Cytoplasmic tRNA 2-thiolation protein 2 n=1 Tax=Fonsecaea multimorphosa CBS 102226 TaxID=1442371 RepID=A0A0D2KJY6_9EURO|nr:uncharacterized protein Z520_00476 [Fonsecaea multimorphosa CBS 102226]KIY03785.1 hypothetical protein Z520_00476 [Fonsecaea multimorphosa CBS 102226]OAL32478.1 hypothetical protein AYO22_00500 [Fonsecaea multimorphosa]
MTTDTQADVCVDCQDRDACLDIRNRRLCATCFIRYVNSKILKRMESYRFKNLAGDQKRRLFLPLSGGVSSLVLLQVLDAQLQKQMENRNRSAYDLFIARVVLPDSETQAEVESQYQGVSSRFPLHNFLSLFYLHDVFRLDERIERDLIHLGINRQDGEPDDEFLHRVLSSTTSVTARADLKSILLQRLLVTIAKQETCEAVLWGHSDSRLAALALADVAKGRGGSVSSTIADGPSMHGLNFNYPARDLFKVELQTYARALPDPLLIEPRDDVSERQATTIRNTSIDDLLSNYIDGQGVKYPSIMANVVRTASKLQVQATDHEANACPVCDMPAMTNSESSWGNNVLCYGCARLKQDIRA